MGCLAFFFLAAGVLALTLLPMPWAAILAVAVVCGWIAFAAVAGGGDSAVGL